MLQFLQNKAAHSVSKLRWNVPTDMLLAQGGWLSVKQLVFYHSVTMPHNVLTTGSPEYLYELYQLENPRQYGTRLAARSHIGLRKPESQKPS